MVGLRSDWEIIPAVTTRLILFLRLNVALQMHSLRIHLRPRLRIHLRPSLGLKLCKNHPLRAVCGRLLDCLISRLKLAPSRSVEVNQSLASCGDA